MSVRGNISQGRLKRLLRISDAFAAGESRLSVRKRLKLSDYTMQCDMELLREHTRAQLEERLAGRTGKPAPAPVKTCVYLVRGPAGFVPCGARAKGQYCTVHAEATRPIGRTVVMLGPQASVNTKGGRAR